MIKKKKYKLSQHCEKCEIISVEHLQNLYFKLVNLLFFASNQPKSQQQQQQQNCQIN